MASERAEQLKKGVALLEQMGEDWVSHACLEDIILLL
jgi:hypothetical protein